MLSPKRSLTSLCNKNINIKILINVIINNISLKTLINILPKRTGNLTKAITLYKSFLTRKMLSMNKCFGGYFSKICIIMKMSEDI